MALSTAAVRVVGGRCAARSPGLAGSPVGKKASPFAQPEVWEQSSRSLATLQFKPSDSDAINASAAADRIGSMQGDEPEQKVCGWRVPGAAAGRRVKLRKR